MSNIDDLIQEIDQSGLFDQEWYKDQYPDAAMLGMEPLRHFVEFGLLLRRNPGPQFNTRDYMSAYNDVVEAGMPAFLHYIRHGRDEGRFGCPNSNADVDDAPIEPADDIEEHYELRPANDAFALRGLSPSAPLAIIANAANDEDWIIIRRTLEALGSDHDLFLLGDHKSLDLRGLPITLKSISLLGVEDERGNARGFVRLAASGALDSYASALWLSPHDAPDLSSVDETTVTALHDAFASDADWACASDLHLAMDGKDAAQKPLLNAVNLALSRLGLSLAGRSLSLPAGWAVWFKPVLTRILGVTVRPFEMSPDGASGSFPGRATVAAMLAAAAQEASMRSAPHAVAVPATPAHRDIKAIAFYLPQFHPIPENDKWWGKGFTEWTNVVRGRPLFRNHYQPRIPADLGYYDLRLEDSQVAQADLARQFGIHGFCFYYYWFNGKKLLNHPIEQMARSQNVDAGFCVCWANENWSRNWDGQNRHVMLEQKYSLESNIAFIHEMIPMMKDARWIRHQGKPVLLVYRISIIPNWLETARIWREECRKAGLGEIHLCAVRFGLENLDGQPHDHGLDSYVLFPPHEGERLDLRGKMVDLHKDFGGEVFSYDAVVDGDLKKYEAGYEWPVHRGAMLGWDNTARRLTDSRIFHGATPFGFRRWMKGIVEQESRFNPKSESLVFINAWNEWAEGTYLEPDQRWGTANLQAFKSAVGAVPGARIVPVEKGIAQLPKARARLEHMGNPLKFNGAMPREPKWYEGQKQIDPLRPTILLCAHISGHQLFGGERSLLDILEALSFMPVNVIMTLPSDNNQSYIKRVQQLCAGAYAFHYPQWMDDRAVYAWLALDFADIIVRHGVDIVHANTIVLLEPVIAARRTGRVPIIHVRELISLDEGLQERMKHSTGEIVNAVFERTDWLIGNSRATCDLFARGDRTLYVPNAVTIGDFEMRNLFGNAIKFGIVSSNIPKKGISDFVEVARRAADRTDRAKFIIVGPRNAQIDAWMAEVAAGERPDNLIFAGYKESARAAMLELNVLLNLSGFAESFGRTVAEAMAARRPVIAYRWGALPELVQHGETGYMVPYRDIQAVVDAVVDICEDDTKIGEMGEKGHAFVSKNFSQDRLRNLVAEAYEKMLERPMREQGELNGKPRALARATIGASLPTTIIIPVYNAPGEVRNCITSVLQHTNLDDTAVLVIDDGSPDPAIKPLLDEFEGRPGLSIVRSAENQGYTRTINIGIAQAAGRDVVLLNSDTIVTPRWLEGLRATAYSQPKVGTVTAMGDNAGAFSFPTFNQQCSKPDYLTHEEYALLMLQGTFACEPPEVPTGSGFCMFIRRALMDECGVFDVEGFPRGYGEENDFCLRALKAGWKNLISPWAFVYHVRTASFKGEKANLIKAGVDVVTKRYPDYAPLVRAAFASPSMMELRAASAAVVDKL